MERGLGFIDLVFIEWYEALVCIELDEGLVCIELDAGFGSTD